MKKKKSVKDWLKTLSMCSAMTDNALIHNWSGYTFMTEHENERIERAYQEARVNSKIDRVVWKSFNKKLSKKLWIIHYYLTFYKIWYSPPPKKTRCRASSWDEYHLNISVIYALPFFRKAPPHSKDDKRWTGMVSRYVTISGN